jgi:hypothetical protein
VIQRLHHFTARANLASIFATGLAANGTVSLGADRFLFGAVWLTANGLESTDLPITEEFACISVRFPKTLSRRLVHWPTHARKHGLQVDAGGNAKPDSIYFFKGPIPTSRFDSVKLLTGQVVTATDFINDPIVVPPIPECPGWATFVDCRGMEIRASCSTS